MRTLFVLILFAACLAGTASAQQPTISDTPLSDRIVSYRMNVSLDPDARTVTGTERLTWRNTDRVPVSELQFHLYLNAFRDNNSTFMKESGGVHRGFTASGDDRWGGVEISSMRIASAGDADLNPSVPAMAAADLTERIRFIQPDDGNTDDRTVIAVTLPEPVAPGATIVLDIEFQSKLPEIVARTGWKIGDSGRPFFMVGQWFPKIGVYELPGQRYVPADAPQGKWNTHQFHSNTEFYADFGTYDVTIEAPEDFQIGASGRLQSEDLVEGKRTVRYLANDVHDFAWTASPDFLVSEDTWKHVTIRLLLQPAHRAQEKRHFDAAKVALERYDEWVGEYPYTTLTLVDGLGGSNGMEYPTLITCGTVYKLPEKARALELVTIHEFGHQYFYGLLASNEFEEAWLDEGMNSYVESRIVDDAYGPGAVIDIMGLSIDDTGFQRVGYTKNSPSRGAMFTKAWEYRFGDYGKNSYAKPATVMNTLERYLGWDTMHRFLRTYYDTWRFRHPSTRDIQQVAEDVSGQDLDWFFDSFVYGTAVVDYAVSSVSNQRIETEGVDQDSTDSGVADSADSTDSVDDAPRRRSGPFKSTVIIERKGDGVFPQTLRVTFDDGETEDRSWDGVDKWTKFEYEHPTRLVEAFVDPDNQVLLDVNRLNNRKVLATRANGTLARKAQLRMSSFLQTLLILFSGLL